jgi:hypothetical protein
MAFTSIDRAETVRVVVSTDPAIDADGSDFEKYGEDFDESHLKFKPGEEPTRFVLGPISYLKFQGIKDRHISFDVDPSGTQAIKTNLFGLTGETLAQSLRKIENGPFQVKLVGGRANDSTMDKLFAIGVVEELGSIALEMNGFGDDDKKKF